MLITSRSLRVNRILLNCRASRAYNVNYLKQTNRGGENRDLSKQVYNLMPQSTHLVYVS